MKVNENLRLTYKKSITRKNYNIKIIKKKKKKKKKKDNSNIF